MCVSVVLCMYVYVCSESVVVIYLLYVYLCCVVLCCVVCVLIPYPETADSVAEEAVEALGNLLGLDGHCCVKK